MDGKDFVVVVFLPAWVSAGSCDISTLLAFFFKEIILGVHDTSHFVIDKLKTLISPRGISSALSSLTTNATVFLLWFLEKKISILGTKETKKIDGKVAYLAC